MGKHESLPITAARVIITCPGRNFVTLKIEAGGEGSRGLHGLGDATLNGRELPVASYLTDHVIPLLIGRVVSASSTLLALAEFIAISELAVATVAAPETCCHDGLIG